MSVTKTTADGVTVLTLTSDPQSQCPPLCQILKTLCYSPPCCSLSQHLKKVQGTSQSILGALQIMVGLMNIGLGAIITGSAPWWRSYNYLFTFWLGALFILFGVFGILSEKCPSPCLVICNVILNLSGAGFALAAIILNSINMAVIDTSWLCERDYDYNFSPTLSPKEKTMTEKCYEAEQVVLMLLQSLFALMIVLAVLEFCLAISSAVLGIKTLCSTKKGEHESPDDSNGYNKLQEADAASNPTV